MSERMLIVERAPSTPVHAYVEGRIKLPGVSVELRTYNHVRAEGPRSNSDQNILGFFSSRTPPIGVRRAGRSDCFARLGRTVLLPRDSVWEFDNPGGPITALICAFDQTQVAFGRDEASDLGFDVRCASLPRVLSLMVREIRRPSLASRAMMDSLWTSAEIYLQRYFGCKGAAASQATYRLSPAQVLSIEKRLLDRDRPVFTVAELARECNMSRQQLSRNFHASTGETLRARIARAQLENAKHLLRHSDLPIKQVAYQVGFSTVSNFGTSFRRAVGCTPRAFRFS